jgi:hypothetical protein
MNPILSDHIIARLGIRLEQLMKEHPNKRLMIKAVPRDEYSPTACLSYDPDYEAQIDLSRDQIPPEYQNDKFTDQDLDRIAELINENDAFQEQFALTLECVLEEFFSHYRR